MIVTPSKISYCLFWPKYELIFRCGVSEDFVNKQKQLTKVVWPPSSNSTASTSWGRPRFANPNFGTKMQLFSRTNFNLAVYADGSVSGTQDDNDLHSKLFSTESHRKTLSYWGTRKYLYVCSISWTEIGGISRSCPDPRDTYKSVYCHGPKRTTLWRGDKFILIFLSTSIFLIFSLDRYVGRRNGIHRIPERSIQHVSV